MLFFIFFLLTLRAEDLDPFFLNAEKKAVVNYKNEQKIFLFLDHHLFCKKQKDDYYRYDVSYEGIFYNILISALVSSVVSREKLFYFFPDWGPVFLKQWLRKDPYSFSLKKKQAFFFLKSFSSDVFLTRLFLLLNEPIKQQRRFFIEKTLPRYDPSFVSKESFNFFYKENLKFHYKKAELLIDWQSQIFASVFFELGYYFLHKSKVEKSFFSFLLSEKKKTQVVIVVKNKASFDDLMRFFLKEPDFQIDIQE
jgi:hypothetical protein